jgi:asparagine synthase (glutamine-hydrolysing)
MCGIAGMIDPRFGREAGETLLKRMLESIRHRGPDHSSVWVDPPVLLGHNRLSIIDLSERANQPMEFDGLVIVYEGEVYNYIEIREELERKGYRFRTASDTEVILAAYREWGGDCVQRFVGMWAFAIWDKAKKELFCSRDRFGIKPFYYIHAGDRFYFGSEYKPLKLSPLFNPAFNLRQIGRGVRFSMTGYRDETYFECLKALPERCNLVFKDGRVSVSPYWDIDLSRKFSGSFEEKKERFLELFRDSVRLHMRSDVAVGGMLSGGMDTSSIASVIGTDFSGVRYKTFTIYYEGGSGMDERPWVREVASTYSNIEPVFYNPSEEDVAGSFDAVVKAYDVPLLTPRPVSRYFVMKTVANHNLKVVLDGEGSDEYLAGYPTAFRRHIAGYIRRLQFIKSLKTLNDLRKRHSLGFGAARILFGGLLRALTSERTVWTLQYRRHRSLTLIGNRALVSLEQMPGSPLDQHVYHSIFTDFLPSLLHRNDRLSMAFSLECRVPFLDHRLVEFGVSLEDEDKIREGQTKYILRKSLEGILPSAILARRDKQGFPSGETAKWLRGPLRYLINPQTFDGLGVVDERKARRILQRFQEGDERKTSLAWKLATLNYWANHQ